MVSSTSSKNAEIISYVVVIVIIGVIFAAIFYVYKAQQLTMPPPEESQVQVNEVPGTPAKTQPTPTPTPTKLFHGKDTYNISGGAPDDPHFPQVTIDPLDPNVGDTQAFTVDINSKYPVTKAYLSIRTDTKTTQVPLTLASGDTTKGVWQATWTVPESFMYNYLITPTAQTAYTQGSATITIRKRP